MAIVGYARVSTRDQDLAGQFAELKAAGCELVYREKVSSAASDRKELARLVRKLERGDTVIVMRLDRLARSTRDLLNILDEIGKAGAGFRSIKDTWADTTTSHGRLMLTILGGLAEFERELIKDRTDAGRVRAKARGVKFGRKPKLNPFQREQALARLSSGETQAEDKLLASAMRTPQLHGKSPVLSLCYAIFVCHTGIVLLASGLIAGDRPIRVGRVPTPVGDMGRDPAVPERDVPRTILRACFEREAVSIKFCAPNFVKAKR